MKKVPGYLKTGLATTVHFVANYRIADGRQVNANLVGTARLGFGFT
jgi:hypothetical protein